jgi:hypothetical protein
MSQAGSRLRATAALAVGAFALHQARYTAGYGETGGDALAAHGHGYLTLVAPLVALLAAVAAAQFVVAVARPGGVLAPARRGPRFATVWLAATLALLATYAGQELLEGALAPGHPAGFDALLAGGGWWALPLASAIGLAVAALLRVASAAVEAASRRRQASPARRPAVATSQPPSVDLPALPLAGRHLAGRAPPRLTA